MRFVSVSLVSFFPSFLVFAFVYLSRCVCVHFPLFLFPCPFPSPPSFSPSPLNSPFPSFSLLSPSPLCLFVSLSLYLSSYQYIDLFPLSPSFFLLPSLIFILLLSLFFSFSLPLNIDAKIVGLA